MQISCVVLWENLLQSIVYTAEYGGSVVSTIFQVLPGISTVPTYNEVLELANMNINDFLSAIGVRRNVTVNVNLINIETYERKTLIYDDIMVSDEEHYAWFYIDNIPGGSDCYYHRNVPIDREVWEDELCTNLNAQKNQLTIRSNMEIGYQWSFRRSAGQPAIVALSYGMLAASLAKLTNGIIYTDDGAWDYSLFPVTANDFCMWYLKPELAVSEEYRIMAQDCINRLRSEFK